MNPDEVLQIFNNTFKDFETRIEKRLDKGEEIFEEIIKEQRREGEKIATLEAGQRWSVRISMFIIAILGSVGGIFFKSRL